MHPDGPERTIQCDHRVATVCGFAANQSTAVVDRRVIGEQLGCLGPETRLPSEAAGEAGGCVDRLRGPGLGRRVAAELVEAGERSREVVVGKELGERWAVTVDRET